ncbi:hypothetical protein A2707_00305 [Candidatus Saccharibacteria bacterium RIFCSPHIGHO2_01_FULL_45_15]|nr:MAG: hypothetical protein A2707_00305 [Candidatus Saccharibacteria bacterium RIFCSPHIGHO2_01_FULL_45_15]OGL27498.1 MAG: hypothetical protein A3C39_03290 [Candidatus Saccharibacteria bacterium RIFCSPHIGHO2_02_FULL_46_12]OGL32126.1 MAG: hypothetical protein A3E76_03960 [Candidatus Saccharibacteria bacterium RIFCSPHIGHO2_12_FULL_44_22]
MTKTLTNRHTFIVNSIGALGYVSILLVWLLVINAIIHIAALQQVLTSTSSSLYAFAIISDDQSSTSDTEQHAIVRFLLASLLLIVVWILVYFASKVGSRIVRHFLLLFGVKVTAVSLIRAKYFWLAFGLVLLASLLVFVPNVMVDVKLPLALIGFTAGATGVGAIWVQSVLAARYRVKIDDLV